jgi:hypothetical protein
MGRFDLDTSENFNRHYPDLAAALFDRVQSTAGHDPPANVATVRQAPCAPPTCSNGNPTPNCKACARRLLGLAFDADLVLDLHCDCEGRDALLHRRSLLAPAGAAGTSAAMPGRLLAKIPVATRLTNACPACGGSWPMPVRGGRHRTRCRRPAAAPPSNCVAKPMSATRWRKPTRGHFCFLQHGCRCAECARHRRSACHPPVPATPLAGSKPACTVPGVVVFAAEPGQTWQAGDLVAEIIDPIATHTHRVDAGVAACCMPAFATATSLRRWRVGQNRRCTAFSHRPAAGRLNTARTGRTMTPT